MRNIINLRIKSKLNFTIHKLNEEITLSNINCDKKKKKKLSQKNINEEKKIQLAHDDHSIFITIIGI